MALRGPSVVMCIWLLTRLVFECPLLSLALGNALLSCHPIGFCAFSVSYVSSCSLPVGSWMWPLDCIPEIMDSVVTSACFFLISI